MPIWWGMLWIVIIIAGVVSWAMLSLLGNERQRRMDELHVKVLHAARNSKAER